ncbi:MAG TPA: dienelactone hydrolase family protein, partial [Pyrinomonadaceae bacterium]
MKGRMVQFSSNGGTTPGYLAIPEKGSGPGVVVIQEWWGLVDHIKDVCDRFAAEGYVALAPDLYHGETTKSPGEAGKMMMSLQIDQAEKDLRGAIKYLLDLEATTADKVGTV